MIDTRRSQPDEITRIKNLVIHHALGAWTHRWLATAVAWAIGLAGVVYVYSMPDIYEASTVVHVDTESLLQPLLKGLAVETEVMNDVSVMTQAIVSRPNLEAVAKEIDLHLRATTPEEYERALVALEGRIDISQNRGNLFTISYGDANRETALSVVRSLLNTFVEETLGSKTDDSVQAEQMLKGQLQDYENRLMEAEDLLKQFKQEHVGIMPGAEGDYYKRLQAALDARDDVEQQLRIERKKRSALQSQLDGEVSGTSATALLPGEGDTPSDIRIAELEKRLGDLSIEYTDKHPEVIRTKTLLEAQRQRYRDLMEGTGESTVAGEVNPIYQSLKIQLGNVDVEIAGLEAVLAEKRGEISRLEEMVTVIPEVEAKLSRLNRDYDVVAARYQEMLGRWENLQTAKRVRSGTDDVQFRVIEPPFADSEPSGPLRSLFLSVASMFALGSGLGLAVLISLLRPVYRSQSELASIGLAVLGSVGDHRLSHDGWSSPVLFGVCISTLVVTLTLATAFADSLSSVVRSAM